MKEELLTIKQTCEYLKVSRVTLFHWKHSNKLVPIKIGIKMKRYRLEDIEKMIANDNPLMIKNNNSNSIVEPREGVK